MTLSRGFKRALAAPVTMVGLTIAVAAIPVESVKSGALAWAQSLTNADRLEYASPAQLSQLPVEYRMAVFASLTTAKDRAAVWQGVFATYRRTHALSIEQDAVLSRAESLLSPALFRSLLTGPKVNEVKATRKAVADALGAAAERELFVTAGEDRGSTASLPLVERLRYTRRCQRPERLVAWVGFVVPGLQALTCNCISTDECGYFMTCGNPVSCNTTSWGCGSWWLEPCTSVCYYPRLEE